MCTLLLSTCCRVSHAAGLLQHEASLHLGLRLLLVQQAVLPRRLPVHAGGQGAGLRALGREQLLLPHRQLLPGDLQRLPQHRRLLRPRRLLPALVGPLVLAAFLRRGNLAVIPGRAVVVVVPHLKK